MNNLPRLIIVTGKGGVGKSTCSLALTKYLTEKGINAVYLTHQFGKLGQQKRYPEDHRQKEIGLELNIQETNLSLKKCLVEYITQKLGSSIIAEWIVKTNFFSSLVEIIPGFSQLIYMGRILQDLEQEPSLHYVVDAAATGHALTLIESIYNFQQIFSIGPLQQDTKRLKDFFTQPGVVKLLLVSIVQEMSLKEHGELKENLKKIDPGIEVGMIVNECMTSSSFPMAVVNKTHYWKKRLEEETMLQDRLSEASLTVPLYPITSQISLINHLAHNLNWSQCFHE